MQSTESPIINLIDVTITHEETSVLKNVSFKIFQGDFVFLIGKTGSGKSSLFKVLYADLPLLHGQGYVADYSLHTLSYKQIPSLRRRLGIVFQDFQLLTDRTVEENLLFVLHATGWKNNFAIKHRISEVLIKVGMNWSLKKMPHQLSGGEQQRIVIARALLNDPIILLADEPTGNLDPEVAEEVLKLFFEINKSGTAVLMATHNYDFIKQNSKRVIKCVDGNVVS